MKKFNEILIEKIMKVSIGQVGKNFALFSGKTKLSKNFKTSEEAEKDYNKNKELYDYWANSAGVSVQNTTPKVIKIVG